MIKQARVRKAAIGCTMRIVVKEFRTDVGRSNLDSSVFRSPATRD